MIDWRDMRIRPLALLRSFVVYYGIPGRGARLRRFYAQFVSRGGLCFDIGAHLGNRVRAWRALGARVVAVEPHPDLVSILRVLYGRDEGVTIVPAAVAARHGEATLLVSPANPTLSTLSSDWTREVRQATGFRHIRWQEGQRVHMITLNELIESYGTPDFVKIDVEGLETEVLRGLDQALQCLSFEYLPAARHRALACVDRLEKLGAYRYNWSPGESHRLAAAKWCSAKEIRRFVEELPLDAGSGDIYARRR